VVASVITTVPSVGLLALGRVKQGEDERDVRLVVQLVLLHSHRLLLLVRAAVLAPVQHVRRSVTNFSILIDAGAR
jgi:ABC-type proline/glycine betaine transport system permease subunit